EIEVALPQPFAVDGRLAAERGALVYLHLDAVALLDRAPERVRLREEHVGVEREHACVRLHVEQQVEENAVLLLERARQRQLRMEALGNVGEHATRIEVLMLSSGDEPLDLSVQGVLAHDETLSIG